MSHSLQDTMRCPHALEYVIMQRYRRLCCNGGADFLLHVTQQKLVVLLLLLRGNSLQNNSQMYAAVNLLLQDGEPDLDLDPRLLQFMLPAEDSALQPSPSQQLSPPPDPAGLYRCQHECKQSASHKTRPVLWPAGWMHACWPL